MERQSIRSEVIIEVCVDSVESARAAAAGGADRIELCAELSVGGITPSHGMIAGVRRAVEIPLLILIRPRRGDFDYTPDELELIERDVRYARQAGADGAVLGLLTSEGSLAEEAFARLVQAAQPMSVTFHRAIDVARDRPRLIERLVGLGVQRVLTSGGAATAPAGQGAIGELVRLAAGRIAIVAGGGVTAENAPGLIKATGITELHVGAAVRRATNAGSPGPDRSLPDMGRRAGPSGHAATEAALFGPRPPVTDAELVRRFVQAVRREG